MKPLYIVGCGGLGLTAMEIHRRGGLAGFEPAGWIDDAHTAGVEGPLGLPILGGRSTLASLPEGAAVLVCVGDNETRLALCRSLERKGRPQPVAIHPDANLFPEVTLGPGSLVNAGAIIARNTTFGAGSIVNLAATIGHDVAAGAGTQISPGANVAGAVTFGEGTFVGPGAVIIQGRTIGPWARVGAGTVVIRDVEAHTTVFGNPARVVERRDPDGT